jgi:WD40 repeat protein
MGRGTFEIAFYPAPMAAVEFPVSALYRPAEERNLTVQRVGGVFRHNAALKQQLFDAQLDHRAYGQALGQAVFQNPIQALFWTALSDTPAVEPLHVLLALEAEALRELRWEQLRGCYGAGDWDFLALNRRTTLSIYVAGATQQKFPPVGLGAINVLLVVASPKGAADAPPFDVSGVASAVAGGLGERVKVLARGVPGASGPPSLERILSELTRERFTILHIVAHGSYPRDVTDFCLVLEKPGGAADRIPGEVLLRELRRLSGKAPYLTFLSACESARPGLAAHDRFADQLARTLALPAVIGMADPISVDTARAVAAAFYESLQKCGRPDVALSEARAGLVRDDEVLLPVLVSQLGGLPLFDESIDTPPEDAAAVERGLARLGQELDRRAPILLGEFGRYSARPPEPGAAGWDEALAELNNWADEVVGVSFNGLCVGTDPPPYRADVCPFNGMKAFDFDRHAFFKARESLVEMLAARLEAERVVAVVGPSGSGKSSVVYAGVLPRLGLSADGFVAVAPGADPLTALDAAIGRAQSPDTLLVVDQFEELFTHHHQDAVQADFLACLNQERERRRVVITMRSEFRERLRGTWLWDLVADPGRDIAPMPADDLRRAMEEQAAAVGLRFEANLVSLVLDDVGDEPGRMPLLQHTLRELWRRRRGVWLKTSEYRALGGVHEAVARTADAFVKGLNLEDHRRVTDVFLRLTRVADETDVTNQTRRRVRIADLVPAGEGEAQTRDLFTLLTNEYLVVTAGNTAEVAHEALIRHWGTIGEWVHRHRAALLIRQAVADEARAWEHGNRQQDGLMRRGARLCEGIAVRNHSVLRLNAAETLYLDECAQAQVQEQRFRRRVRIGLLASLIATLLLGGCLVFLSWREMAEKSRAELLAQISKGLKLAWEANQLRTYSPSRLEEATLLAAEGWKRYPSVTTGRALQEAVSLLARREHTLEHSNPLRSVAFSPAGALCAMVGEDRRIKIWDISTGLLRAYELPRAGLGDAVALSDAGHIAVADGRRIQLYSPNGKGTRMVEHSGPGTVFSVDFSKSGRYVCASSHEKWGTPADLCIWDLNGDIPALRIRRTGSGDRYADKAVFSPAETHVAITIRNAVPEIWDLDAGKQGAPLHQAARAVMSVAFADDGKRVAAGEFGGVVRVWNVADGSEIIRLKCNWAAVALAFDHHGIRLAAGGGSEVRVWNVPGGEEQLYLPHGTVVNCVQFSPDDRSLVTGSQDGTLRIWRGDRGLEINRIPRELDAKSESRFLTRFTPDGRHIVAQASSSTVGVWSVGRGDIIYQVSEGTGAHAAILSLDNRYLATASPGDGGLRVWAVGKDNVEKVFENRGGGEVVFSRDARFIAASLNGYSSRGAVGTSKIWVYDIAARQEVAEITHQVTMPNWAEAKPGQPPHFPEIFVKAITFSEDGNVLASSSSDGTLKISRAVGGEKEFEVNLTAPATLMTFSDEHHLTVVCTDGKVRTLTLPSGETRDVFVYSDDSMPVALSPGGAFLATVSKKAIATIWNISTGKVALKFQSRVESARRTIGASPVQAATFSGDNRYFAVSQFHDDAGIVTIRVYDLPRGQEVTQLVLEDPAAGISFGPDGRYFVTAGFPSTVRLWRNEDLFQLARQRLSRNLTRSEWAEYTGDDEYRKMFEELP